MSDHREEKKSDEKNVNKVEKKYFVGLIGLVVTTRKDIW